MRIEDLFRMIEAKMPATQGQDRALYRKIPNEDWYKLKQDITAIVSRSGGIQTDTRPLPKSHALVPIEPPDPLGPAEFDPDEIYPITSGPPRHSLM